MSNTLVSGEWIPCAERLPVQYDTFYDGGGTGYHRRISDVVLVTIGRRERLVTLDYVKNGKWVKYRNDVIAWMPLPEPYREDKNEIG